MKEILKVFTCVLTIAALSDPVLLPTPVETRAERKVLTESTDTVTVKNAQVQIQTHVHISSD